MGLVVLRRLEPDAPQYCDLGTCARAMRERHLNLQGGWQHNGWINGGYIFVEELKANICR